MFRRGLLGYLPVNLVQGLAGVGAVMAFTRILSPAAYGAYALSFAASSLLSLIAFTWIEAAMARFVQRETTPQGRADLFRTLYLAFAAAALACPAGIGVLSLLGLDAGLKIALTAGILAAAARALVRLSQERRRALGEVRGFAALDLLQTVLGFAFGVALALAGLKGAAPLAGAGLASLIALLFTLKPDLAQTRGGRFSGARLRVYAAYGLPVSLSLMMSLALATTDRFVLAANFDQATVGAYQAGYALSNRTLDLLFLWLGMAGQPACVAAFERGGRPALMKVASAQGAAMVLIALPAAVGLMLVSDPLARLLIGPALAPRAAAVTPFIALGALFSGLTTHYFNTAYTLARTTRRLFLVNALPAAANLILVLVLVPRHGLLGAVLATVLSYALGLCASILLSRGALALPIPWSSLLKCGLASALMAEAISLTPPEAPLASLGLKIILGVLVYAGAVLALDAGGVRAQALGLVRQLRPGLFRGRTLST